MWDLDTLRYLNEQAYLSSLKMVNAGVSGTTTQPRPAPVFPLALLAAKLIVGPPSIVRLIDLLEDSDSVAEFLGLVRAFLPEHEADIMAAVDDRYRIERFCHYFGNQYFPLEDVEDFYDDLSILNFMHHIPVPLMGFSWDDYEQFNDFRDSFILLLSMVESPYNSDERLPILERVKDIVGKSLVELIPADGWELADIHRMFEGSQYEGVVAFADWIHSTTGCMQLDASYADCGPEMWSSDIVHGLTAQWPTVIDIQEQMNHLYVWLEEDMHHNFGKLLEIMLGIEVLPPPVPKEQMSLPLDDDGQVIRKERR